MPKHGFEVFGPFAYRADLRSLFRQGELARSWSEQFPKLFSTQDLQRAIRQPDNHFVEWAAAVHLHQRWGYLSVQKYEFPVASAAKAPTVAAVLGEDIREWLHARQKLRVVQCPDLLVYSADLSDVYFCEVKGPGDRIREPQVRFFEELQARTGRIVKVLQFTTSRHGLEA